MYGGAILGLLCWFGAWIALEPGAAWVTARLAAFLPGPRAVSAAGFFLYEAPKVLLLLVLIVFFVGILRSFFTPDAARRLLSGRRELTGYGLAAALGVVTPFCSCSAVPLFIGFLTAGVPLGVTFTFLISAPMVNEVALVLLFGMFGWKVAALYLTAGLAIALVSGLVLGRLKLEGQVEAWVWDIRHGGMGAVETRDFADRIRAGLRAVVEVTGKVWPWILVGIAVGAGIHGWMPEAFLSRLLGKSAWWSVPVAVLLGVPMYANAAGMVPVVGALVGKGAALGTVLAFMMSVIALSLPELILLRKVLRPRLLATFVGVVAIGILFIGWLFNLIL